MLEAIAPILMAEGLVNSQWQTETKEQGDLVKLFRDYYDGYQRMQLTPEMKKMLNISDERLERYNANYCELIIGSMADRLTVDKFEVTPPKVPPAPIDPNNLTPLSRDVQVIQPSTPKEVVNPGQQWIDDLMEANRFDALQIDVREAALRDGNTFIMEQYEDEEGRVCLYHELAYNGDVGMIAIWDADYSELAAAVKIWYEVPQTVKERLSGETDTSQYKRVNIYYPDRTAKYYSTGAGSALVSMDDVPEETIYTERQGQAPGVPVVCFSNKGGVSELVNIIPLQDSLNSALVDLVMAGRLTAFSIMFAVNVDVPQGITPGMTIYKKLVDADGAAIIPENGDDADRFAKYLAASRLERIGAGDLTQIIKGIELIINQISVISSTPIPGMMGGDSASGEAIKQRDVRLLGKLNRAQVQLGNAWEDVIDLANMQQTLFSGKKAPELGSLNTRWKSAEIRNNADVLALFKLLNDAGYERAALRTLSQSSLANWSEADIDKMIAEKAKDVASKMSNAFGSQNGFDSFNVPTNQPLNFNPAPVAAAG